MSPARSTTRTPATEVRSSLITAGRRLLEREGAAALTVRAVATEAGVAPMGVYNHFDGKVGLLNAVVTDGFTEFARMIAVTDADPTERLLSSGRRYREFALANPTLYQLMFSVECEPDIDAASDAFGELVEIVRYGQAAGTIRVGDAAEIAAQVWAGVHGAVSLELASTYPPIVDATRVYTELLDLIARGIRP
ncbi:TetR/AcrR family transcriptional regulator [Gordonia sp. CPCC 205515]|uniref:TetR/AcrR family transcriptional regulator n=1 Tax=Gordonia sp. CPCC 205515 TaxID=3140791 RepID=UPI003AF3C42A